MKVTWKLEGAQDLQRALEELPKAMQRRVATVALRAGARVIRDEARRLVPVETGELRRGIKVVTFRQRKQGERTVTVWVAGPERFLAPLIEFGTSAHVIKPKRKRVLSNRDTARAGDARGIFGAEVEHPGIRPRPFIRPAADSKAKAALDTIGREIGVGIERELDRTVKKALAVR